MRLFCELIYDDLVRNNVEVYSSPKFNDLLGRADDLVYEVIVSEAAGTSVNLTLRHLHSSCNEGTFTALASLISGDSLSAPPYQKVVTQGGPLGAYGKVGIKLNQTDNTARVRVWVTGRGTGRG